MHINFQIRWRLGPEPGREIEPELFRLLRAIETEGALAGATRNTGMSYRHAWGMLRRWEKHFHSPLVILERGRGANLTAFGKQLLELDDALAHRFGEELERAESEFSSSLTEFAKPSAHRQYRVLASHGMAIQEFLDLVAAQHVLEFDHQTCGSLDSLRALAHGRCDLAGFHFPLEEPNSVLAKQYLRWLDAERHWLLLLATRRQGIMVQPGNPKRIHALADLARRSVRFINRQRGSGTRTILDALLEQARIPASDISGYAHEEFTHDAVAAIIAGGAAHAGFGIEAAAARFGLEFVPVLREAYLLAGARERDDALRADLADLMRSQRFASRMDGLAGYDVGRAGTKMTFAQLFGA